MQETIRKLASSHLNECHRKMQEIHQIIATLTFKWVPQKLQENHQIIWHVHMQMSATEKMQENIR